MQQRDCPVRFSREVRANRSHAPFYVPIRGALARVDLPNQLYEIYDKTGGGHLGMSEKILRWVRLSGRMYKIRTLLSTDIVDNVVSPMQGMGRKALLHAACRACPPYVWRGGR